jgi:hypothetical protein
VQSWPQNICVISNPLPDDRAQLEKISVKIASNLVRWCR